MSKTLSKCKYYVQNTIRKKRIKMKKNFKMERII